jgi:hypothetical protein
VVTTVRSSLVEYVTIFTVFVTPLALLDWSRIQLFTGSREIPDHVRCVKTCALRPKRRWEVRRTVAMFIVVIM